MSGPLILTLAEFEGIYACDEPSPPVREGLHPLDRKRFAQLEELALRLASQPENDSGSVLSLCSRKGVGKVVSARNHVGVVALADGTQIEILPKTIRSFGVPGSTERKDNEENHRNLFLRMLRETWDLDAKEATPAELRAARLPVFEAFIRMFLGCVSELVKRGLPGGYARIESNETFFKGKLLVVDHIRNNIVRKDRFFVAHDEHQVAACGIVGILVEQPPVHGLVGIGSGSERDHAELFEFVEFFCKVDRPDRSVGFHESTMI